MSHSTKVKTVPMTDVSALMAVAADLRAQGVNCEMLTNAQPRMFYPNQLQMQMGQKSEICPFVLRLADSRYDVGFLKQEDGSYMPVFDAWAGEVSKVLGCDPTQVVEPLEAGATEATGSWGSDSTDSVNLSCCISKLLRSYSKQAAINAAVSAGYSIADCQVDSLGEVHITVQV